MGYLILNRKPGESIIIDGKIEIKVCEYRNNKVRIAVDAPESITVHRKEIHDKIKEGKGRETSRIRLGEEASTVRESTAE